MRDNAAASQNSLEVSDNSSAEPWWVAVGCLAEQQRVSQKNEK
jgi:hypothetical protein